jgi:TPR repeat protein
MTARYPLWLLALTIISLNAALAQAGKSDVCPRDEKEFAAIQQRAEAKDPVAQMALASCYDLGSHVQPDGKESVRWLAESAKQGYAPAQSQLGRTFLYGRGIDVDYEKALLWERKAAEQGDQRAQRDLAFMYERGFGVPADPAQAAEWNRKAAAQGEPAAQLEVARKFAKLPDCAQAMYWYKEAVVHGISVAMYELGMLYLDTKCSVDRNQAFIWLTLGGRFGLDDSKTKAEQLAKTLTLTQKKRDLVVVEKWLNEHPNVGEDEDEKEKEER